MTIRIRPLFLLAATLLVTTLVYWHGLRGSFVFDDYANIVENQGVHIQHATMNELAGAALSSPSSDFRRPLASLSFALNYLATGLDPWPMKFTNLLIHLCNGLLLYLMLSRLLRLYAARTSTEVDTQALRHIALMVTACWLLLPINLTSVLYVVQRMESLAQLAVLAGLCGYLHGRRRMLAGDRGAGIAFAAGSLLLGTAVGAFAKESAVLLPLYAFLIECTVLRFSNERGTTDRKLIGVFLVLLILPAMIGLVWLLPHVFSTDAYAGRRYTLGQRLLTEPRVLMDYLRWTLFPDPRVLSLYHDDVQVSTGLFSPLTTSAAIVALLGLLGLAAWQVKSRPLLSLGILWFFAAHLLTATVIPLELVYEHRNYFASIGVLLFLATLLLGVHRPLTLPIVRYAIAMLFVVLFAAITWLRADAWSNPITLAIGDANRHPDSPRANYEAGRLLLVASHYDQNSRELKMAEVFIRRAADLPSSSSLSLQALLMVNDRSGKPIDAVLWRRFDTKLRTQPVGEEDASALDSLTACRVKNYCHFDPALLQSAFYAALSHPGPQARLLGAYADFAMGLLHDDGLAERSLRTAVRSAPNEPGYRIGLARLLAIHHRDEEASHQIEALRKMNAFGRLDTEIMALENLTKRSGLPNH